MDSLAIDNMGRSPEDLSVSVRDTDRLSPMVAIEDYAFLSDVHTGALVSTEGSIDWLCFPRFDSPAIFTALLGTPEHGRWLMAPTGGTLRERHYLDGTFALVSTWDTPTGTCEITEFMPVVSGPHEESDIVRHVRCTSGTVTIQHDIVLRFNYGESVPWVERTSIGGREALYAVAGPTAIYLTGPLPSSDGHHHTGSFELSEGDTVTWDMSWTSSTDDPPTDIDADKALEQTTSFWRSWSSQIEATGPYAEAVARSLLVLRALTDLTTGGIVAAATTSLPEEFGGVRNWDYRYTWLRDSALTIEALVAHGFTEGALAWRNWLLRAIAGDPFSLRIMYGLDGERHLPEFELDHLPGYENSTPIRIGNGAAGQYQADVVGEVIVALHKLREAGIEETERSWGLQKALLQFAEDNLDRKEHGIWEMRGELADFTHSRVMVWAAFDRGVKAVEDHGLDGPVDHWRNLRDQMRDEIESKGWNEEIQSYTQTYGSTEVDASLLQMPQVGFIDYDDPKMIATVAKIEADLQDEQGFIHRYRTDTGTDGIAGDEYPFLICCFWLVEQYALMGRGDDARTLMDRLVATASDLGLLAEEYSPAHDRLAGNFPQAFSHLGLIRASDALSGTKH